MEKGIAEGMEKGMAEGAEKEKRDTLIRMQKAGTSIDIMAIATGLSAEEVKRLLSL